MFNRVVSENRKNLAIPIISLAIGIAYINFAVYVQLNFLHSVQNACAHIPISFVNLSYFIISGIIIAAIANIQLLLLKNKVEIKTKELGLIGIGPLLAGLSLVCGACSLPIIGLIGINSALTFLGEFQLLIKILSMLLISLGLYLSIGQFNNKCVLNACEINIK